MTSSRTAPLPSPHRYLGLFAALLVLRVTGLLWSMSEKSGDVTITPKMRECIHQVTGLDEKFPLVSARWVTADEANTPLLPVYAKDEKGIKVTLRPGRLKLKSLPPELDDKRERHFSVFLSADGAQVLAITTSEPDRPPVIRTQMPLESNPNAETYEAFPKQFPKVTFLKALESTMDSPYLADDIDGLYIIYSKGEIADWKTPRPMWMITLRGVPNGHYPEEGPLDMCSAVEPATGTLQFATNLPIYRRGAVSGKAKK